MSNQLPSRGMTTPRTPWEEADRARGSNFDPTCGAATRRGSSIGHRPKSGKASKAPANARLLSISTIGTAERDQRIVQQRRAIGLIGSAGAKEGVEQALDRVRVEIAGDQHDAGALVTVGPARQSHHRMEDVPHTVNDDGARRRLRQL